MSASLEARFPATADGLNIALEAIERFAIARKLHRDLVSRLRITVEELFSNTIKYGYGGECDRPVRISLMAVPVLTLIYEDEAASFDPTDWRPDDADTAPPDRPEGRAGIGLILGLSTSAAYCAGPNGNRLSLTFAANPRAR